MQELAAALAVLIVATVSPGPNNVLVLTTATARGLRAAVQVTAAIVLGTSVLTVLVWAGLTRLAFHSAGVQGALYLAGACFLIAMGLNVAFAAPAGSSPPPRWLDSRLGAAVFQAINPKAWILVSTVSAILSTRFGALDSLGLQLGMTATVSTLALLGWACVGLFVRRSDKPAFARAFDLAMAVMLVLPGVHLLVSAWSLFAGVPDPLGLVGNQG